MKMRKAYPTMTASRRNNTMRDEPDQEIAQASLNPVKLKLSGKTRKKLDLIKRIQEDAIEFAESILDTVREPLIVLDQDLRVVTASRSFYEFFKVKPAETLGQLIYQLGNNQWDIPKLRALLETILPQKSTFDNYEVEHDFTTIGKRTMRLNARQIQRAAGKEPIILLAIEDITEHREIESDLENALKEMTALKRYTDDALEYADSIVNTVHEPLVGLDGNLKVVTASRSFYEFFKVTPEETLGHLIYDLGDKQWDIPRLRDLLETILPQKTTFDNYEVEHDFATIGRRVMLLNGRQVQRAVGKEPIILLAIDDITSRKDLDNRLGKAHQKLETIQRSTETSLRYAENIINTVREPLVALDKDLRIVKVNRSFYEVFKLQPEETLGRLIYSIGNGEWNIPRLRELLENILPNKTQFYNYEVEHNFNAIGRRTMLLNGRQINKEPGKEPGILLAIEDITERRTAELRLAKAHQELEAFAYSVSHDLRAPLRGIDVWSLALLEGCKDKLNQKESQYIDLVRSETQVMGRLIDDLLTFSRTSRSKMNRQRLDMTAMAQAVVARLQQQNPTLQADFIIQPGLMAEGDAGLIEIALTNLLDNAAKFSGRWSRAVIEFGQVEHAGRKALFVRDNGVGFDMAYADKLFGVFQRLHKSSEFAGTGIGLATVQRIIDRHGGLIWAEAVVNQGATFYFTLRETL
jgi:PAS domain S-box-containing protein